MDIFELQQTLELAPVEKKLEALGRLNTLGGQVPLADLQAHLDKLTSETGNTLIRFFATRALIVLGDRRDLTIHTLLGFWGEQLFKDRDDELIKFPWVPKDLPSPDEPGLDSLRFRLEVNMTYAVLETLSHASGSEKVAQTLKDLLSTFSSGDFRTLCIYAMGALGHESNRSILEYYRDNMATTPEGHAAELSLRRFGTASVFDLVREHAQLHAKPAAPKSGCFVVTAVCGNATSFEVQVCRAFRDEVLQKSFLGRQFVRIYYLVSPTIAGLIVAYPALRWFFRLSLVNPVVALLTLARDPQRSLRHRLPRSVPKA